MLLKNTKGQRARLELLQIKKDLSVSKYKKYKKRQKARKTRLGAKTALIGTLLHIFFVDSRYK